MKTLRAMCQVMTLGLCVVALLSAGQLRAEKPTKTITGTVKKADVYHGKVRGVYIKDAQEGEFLVVRSTEIGKELLKQVGVTVRATGYVKKARPDSDFTQVIDVLHYEIVPPGQPDAETQAHELTCPSDNEENYWI